VEAMQVYGGAEDMPCGWYRLQHQIAQTHYPALPKPARTLACRRRDAQYCFAS
jgi:hypothetical protein